MTFFEALEAVSIGVVVEVRTKHFNDYGHDYWTAWKVAHTLGDLTNKGMKIEYRIKEGS